MTNNDSLFAADWLTLREPSDARARSSLLVEAVGNWFTNRAPKCAKVIDLGAGTGANLRFLAPRLAMNQSWTLVDHDASLLARATESKPPHSAHGLVSVTTRAIDLDTCLDALPSGGLVTGSALLDLVTREWIEKLAQACYLADCAVLFALSVDGHMQLADASTDTLETERNDAWVFNQVTTHQRSNKGMGRALGSEAPTILRQILGVTGYHVYSAVTPWRLGTSDLKLALAALDEWARAAAAAAPQSGHFIRAWQKRRQADLYHGRCSLNIGHQDVLGLPIERVSSRSYKVSGSNK